MRTIVLIFVPLALFIGVAKCYISSKPAELCSWADISGENDADPDDIAARFWYFHFVVDPENLFDVDSKIAYIIGSKGEIPFSYQVGRDRETGKCKTLLFQDAQLIRGRPCIAAIQLYPPTTEGRHEYVQLLSPDKTTITFYRCADFDRKKQRCKPNKITVIAGTTSKYIRPGDRERLEATLKRLAGFVPKYRVDRPATNDCEDPILKGLGRLPRQQPKRKTTYRKKSFP